MESVSSPKVTKLESGSAGALSCLPGLSYSESQNPRHPPQACAHLLCSAPAALASAQKAPDCGSCCQREGRGGVRTPRESDGGAPALLQKKGIRSYLTRLQFQDGAQPVTSREQKLIYSSPAPGTWIWKGIFRKFQGKGSPWWLWITGPFLLPILWMSHSSAPSLQDPQSRNIVSNNNKNWHLQITGKLAPVGSTAGFLLFLGLEASTWLCPHVHFRQQSYDFERINIWFTQKDCLAGSK